VHTDHLGSAVRLTDETGQPVQSIAYDPYGRTVFYAGIKGFAYRFTDQEYDAGSALYYYDARYYDPMLGRFIQADTVLDGLNRYAYCGNNPVMYVDPGGNIFGIDDLFIIATIVVGAFIAWVGNEIIEAATGVDIIETVCDFVGDISIWWSTDGTGGITANDGNIDINYDPGAAERDDRFNERMIEFSIQLEEIRLDNKRIKQEISLYGMPVEDIRFMDDSDSYELKNVIYYGEDYYCYSISYNVIIYAGGNPGPDMRGIYSFEEWNKHASLLPNPLPNTFGLQSFYKTGSKSFGHYMAYIYTDGPKYTVFYTTGNTYPDVRPYLLGDRAFKNDWDHVMYIPFGNLSELFLYGGAPLIYY
jgi:RHS repeat-associated protein